MTTLNDGTMTTAVETDFFTLYNYILGYTTSQIVGAATRLGLADHLAGGPRTAAELTDAIQARDSAAVLRFLRAAEAIGLVRQSDDGQFEQTPMLTLLRRKDGVLANSALAMTAPGFFRPWEKLDQVVLHGRAQTKEALGKDLWAYYADNPEEEAWFADFMGELSNAAADSMLGQYEFTGRIVDVGGSHGVFLSRVLQHHPDTTAVLFDLPTLLDGAQSYLKERGLSDRVEFVGGSFLEEVPKGGDVYLLKSILCDWDDESCKRILKCCRDAAEPGTPVVVIDWLYPEDRDYSLDMADLGQLVYINGRVRTLAQYESLFEAAGLELRTVKRSVGLKAVPANVLEAVRR
jgi:predicted O-methyltransferase YrrM